MSIHVMSMVLRADKVVPDRTQTLVLLVLGDYANDDGICWPSIASLARKCRMSVRGIQYALADLKKEGFLDIEHGKGGRASTNLYRISLHRLQGSPTKPEPVDLTLEQETLQFLQGKTPQGGALSCTPAMQPVAPPGCNLLHPPGATAIAPEPSVEPSGEASSGARAANDREAVRSLPEALNTGPFREAWEKWIVHWSSAFNRSAPIPIATADAHLLICSKLGAVKAVEAIENAISRGLREPAPPFPNAGSRPNSSRRFEQGGDFSTVTDK